MTGLVHRLCYFAPGSLSVAMAIFLRRRPASPPVPAWVRRQLTFSSAVLFLVGGGLLALGAYLAWAIS